MNKLNIQNYFIKEIINKKRNVLTLSIFFIFKKNKKIFQILYKIILLFNLLKSRISKKKKT